MDSLETQENIEQLKNESVLEPLPQNDEALIRRSELPNYFPIAFQTWARWASEGTGPKFIKMGKRLVAYRAGDLRQWLNKNIHNTNI